MAQKTVNLPGIGDIVLAKRKGTRHLRLSISADGRVRVGLPHWAPYQAGINFAQSRADWIKKHNSVATTPPLIDDMRIGKSFRLHFVRDDSVRTVRSRIIGNQILIKSPYDSIQPDVQKVAIAACERALKKDAEKLLPMRLKELARAKGFKYRSVRIKRLRSRWGSCSSQQDITLNYYLMQLPWRLIDYVIIHELAHTAHLHHGTEFWQAMDSLLPDVKHLRKDIKSHKPVLTPQAIA